MLSIREMHGPVNRTSPKGPGTNFIGTCAACGKAGLTYELIKTDPCPNQRGLSPDQRVIEAIEGP